MLWIEEVDRPRPKPDEILVRVRASTVSETHTHVRAANPFFWRLIGWLGSAVTGFRVGDAVLGSPSSYLGSWSC